eukprot:8539259-Karenia_brevis.AAC.1
MERSAVHRILKLPGGALSHSQCMWLHSVGTPKVCSFLATSLAAKVRMWVNSRVLFQSFAHRLDLAYDEASSCIGYDNSWQSPKFWNWPPIVVTLKHALDGMISSHDKPIFDAKNKIFDCLSALESELFPRVQRSDV